jgi:hypothetical protein
MNLSDTWNTDQQAWIMPALSELNSDGTVDSADGWPALKTEIQRKLSEYGTDSSSQEELVKPLDEAAGKGENIKVLVSELAAEYEAELEEESTDDVLTGEDDELTGETVIDDRKEETVLTKVPPVPDPAKKDPDDLTVAFTAELPPADQLADQIIMDLGPDIAALIAANPELASVSDKELTSWITEDVQATIDEIAEAGWRFGE